MIRKNVNYGMAMHEWGNLLDSGALPGDQEAMAKSHLAGLKAEKNMAYYLDASFGQDPDLMVFNNLQFAHGGQTAQIDHLVLSRWSAYFIETKSAAHKININPHGEWARVYGRRYINFESPVEQSKRHEELLFSLLASRLPEFMGKMLGMQLTFRTVIDTHHLVAVSVETAIQGRGRKAMEPHLRKLDQIPSMIGENHKAVRSSLLGSVFAEMRDGKTKKRQPAFSEKELEGCCQILLQADISQTPLEKVHAFIESLPREAAALRDAEPEPEVESSPAIGSPATVAKAPTPPACPKCGSPMALRTAARGDRAGKQFFGCTKYPKCKSIINLD
ncbi:MAG: NERD domain-containing protein [Planctomycetota bacterium]|nr:NERD domain-containing protein [Planctomycetota bacterium]